MKKFLLAVAAVATLATANAEGYYLTGVTTGWGTWQPLTEVDGKYEISLETLDSQFLLSDYEGYDAVAADNHQGKIGAKDDAKTTLGEPTEAAFGGGNFTFANDILKISDAKIVFDPTAMTVTVTGTPVNEAISLWVCGTIFPEAENGLWAMEDQNLMTEKDGVYTFTNKFVPGDFKIAGANWNPQFKPSEAVAETGKEYSMIDSGMSNGTWSLAEGTYTITFNFAAKTLSVAGEGGEGGIEGIEADTELPAVYYNLQGVRVNNPENGVFVMVRGNKAVKVVK